MPLCILAKIARQARANVTAKRQLRRKEKPASGNSPVGNSPAAKSSAGKPAAVSLSTRWIECFWIIAAANAIYRATRWRLIGAICENSASGSAGRKIQELTIRDLAEYPALLNGEDWPRPASRGISSH